MTVAFKGDKLNLEGDIMLISGIQKLSLLDYPDKTCATIFTYGCNFRCPFCHNSPLVTRTSPAQVLEENEILDFLEKRKGLLDGVTISGGEPLLQKDIGEFIDKVKAMGFLVKLDTNGSKPDELEQIIDKVDFVAMDIKNSLDKYAETVGLPVVDVVSVCRSAKIIMEKAADYEFRTTIVKELHTIDDIVKIGKWLNGAKRYSLQNFKDSDMVIQSGLHSVSHEWLKDAADAADGFFAETVIKD